VGIDLDANAVPNSGVEEDVDGGANVEVDADVDVDVVDVGENPKFKVTDAWEGTERPPAADVDVDADVDGWVGPDRDRDVPVDVDVGVDADVEVDPKKELIDVDVDKVPSTDPDNPDLGTASDLLRSGANALAKPEA
jgi:hypothetical protein